MKYSLLNKSGAASDISTALYDLSVDRLIGRICKYSNPAYFLKIASSLLTEKKDIFFRREIIKDFETNPGLFDKLRIQLSRYDKLKTDWLEMKSGESVTTVDVSGEVLIDRIYSSLKITAMFPNTVLSMYKSIYDSFDGFSVSSEGLKSLKEHCEKMLSDCVFADVVKIASQFMYNSAVDYTFEALCDFDDTLAISQSSVCSVKPNTKKKPTILFSRKNETDTAHPYTLEGDALEDADNILALALKHTDELLYLITDTVYESLYGLSYELDFYSCALEYTAFLRDRGYPFCYAEISDEPRFITESLRDVYLSSDPEVDDVYSADLSIPDSNSSVIVTGGNGSGKTTFLRSVATAQIFTQVGLPVMAEKAQISIRNGLFTHFSSKEEDFVENDTSGRFESEVSKVADIINRITPGSLVLFNETFQTTSYREGSAAMIDILKALSLTGTQYVFVTHLPGVSEALKDKANQFIAQSENGVFSIKKK